MAKAEQAYTVALVGFAQSESATFETFFRMAAARRPPAYRVQEEVADAQLLVVNADNPQAIHLVQLAELPARVLLIGQHDGGTGWTLEKKPVKLVNVLAALDRLVGLRTAVPRPAPSLDTEFPPTRPMIRHAPHRPAAAPVPDRGMSPAMLRRHRQPGVMRLTDFGGLDDLPVAAPATRSSRHLRTGQQHAASEPLAPGGDMLLVSESLVEGRILHKRFARYGLKIDWSREGRQVAAMLKAHPYRLVVIDRVTGEPDAFQICRQARQRRLPNGQPPTVIMFAPTAGSMDRIKAGLAGSDAYLSRSVSEAELYRILGQHRLVSLDGFAPTDMAF